MQRKIVSGDNDVHLVIEDLGLSGLGLWDQRLIQDIKYILADFLKLGLDLLAVITDGGNVLVGTLGLFLLLDRGDNAPRSTSSSDDVLVGNGQEVSLVNGKLTTQLCHASSVMSHRTVRIGQYQHNARTLATSFMYVTISS